MDWHQMLILKISTHQINWSGILALGQNENACLPHQISKTSEAEISICAQLKSNLSSLGLLSNRLGRVKTREIYQSFSP